MDRRFLIWLLLSVTLSFTYIGLRAMFLPPPELGAVNKNVAEELDAAANPADPQAANDPANPAEPKDDGEIKADGDIPVPPAEEEVAKEDAKPADAPAAKIIEEQRIVLGTMTPGDNYKLLVTLSNRGGSIEKIELVQQLSPGKFKYRRVDDRGSYIGNLATYESPAGLIVGVSPAGGTPAALATSPGVQTLGLQANDVITSVNDMPIRSSLDLRTTLAGIKDGNDITINVNRFINGTETPLTFSTKTIEAPLDLVYATDTVDETVPGNIARRSLLTTLAKIDQVEIEAGRTVLRGLEETLNGTWEMKTIDGNAGPIGVEFRKSLKPLLKPLRFEADLEMVKRFKLAPGGNGDPNTPAGQGYHIEFETEIVNRGEQAFELAMRQEGVNGLTLEGWWYSSKISPAMFSSAGARDIVYNNLYNGHELISCRSIVSDALKSPQMPDRALFGSGELPDVRSLRYIGVDCQYFTSALVANPDKPDSLRELSRASTTAVADVNQIPKAQQHAANVSFWIDTRSQRVAGNESLTENYLLFAGPKDPIILNAYGLDQTIEYGWFPLVAKPLSAILHTFFWLTQNYGIAIVMLTVLVRGFMFPLGRKAAVNAQKMQELAPELKKISEQYKDDWEKRTKATQELYAKSNFRPWSGCLPMFIQLPIFIGLYRCLSVDIELRQQSLIPGVDWGSNLAGPDMLFNWSTWMPDFIAGRGTGWLGPYFNVLPVVTVALFLVQQKMLMPKATDEQTAMTQKMMTYMTMFMGVLFFKVPAGLCIYFITSSIWSLFERKLVKRLMPPSTPSTNSNVAAEPSNQKSLRERASESKIAQSPRTKKIASWLEWVNKQANNESATIRNDRNTDQDKNRKKKK